MALLDWTDFERQTNSTLTNPEGRNLANTIANSILAWSARYCNRLGWEKKAYTQTFSPDEYSRTFYLSALPVDIAQPVSVSTYSSAGDTYTAYTGSVRKNADGIVRTGDALGYGFEAVRIGYTGGYDDATFPADLKQALTELLVQKVNDALNGGMTVTEVRAIDYSEKYSQNTAAIPADTLEVLDSYRLPVVI